MTKENLDEIREIARKLTKKFKKVLPHYISQMLLFHYTCNSSNDERNPIRGLVLHDGFVSNGDIDVLKRADSFWRTEYLPRYRQECRERGLPVLI